MSLYIIDDEKYYVNPSTEDFEKYQTRGLDVHDRKPNDYLRAVSKTFTAFKNVSSDDSLVSYISGFEIDYSLEKSPDELNNIYKLPSYHSFKINAGTCIIDNQLINIKDKTLIMKPRGFFHNDDIIGSYVDDNNIKFCIVILYSYNNQYFKETAQIEIRREDELNFPYKDQKEICFLRYTGNTGTIDSTNGKYGLVLGSFNIRPNDTKDAEKIYKDTVGTGTALSEGINDQNLGQLYMNNYQLLFKYFGLEARKVFSEMQLTHSNFITIPDEQIDDTLLSGMMCYYDAIDCKYKPARASQKRFDLVVGLYLKESLSINQGESVDKLDKKTKVIYDSTSKTNIKTITTTETEITRANDDIKLSGSNVIFFNGIIHLSENRFQLDSDNILLNLVPGQHYYLEDKCTIMDTEDASININGLEASTATGKITPKPFTGAVQVGTAINNNIFLLNISKEQELKVGSLLDIFGDNKTYETFYNYNKDISLYNYKIEKLTRLNTELDLKYSEISNILGVSSIMYDESTYDLKTDFSGEDDNFTGFRLITSAIFRNLFGYDFINRDTSTYLSINDSINNDFIITNNDGSLSILNTDIYNKITGELDLDVIKNSFQTNNVLNSESDKIIDSETQNLIFDNLDNIISNDLFNKCVSLVNNNNKIRPLSIIMNRINSLMSTSNKVFVSKTKSELDKDYTMENSNSKLVKEYSTTLLEQELEEIILSTIELNNISYNYDKDGVNNINDASNAFSKVVMDRSNASSSIISYDDMSISLNQKKLTIEASTIETIVSLTNVLENIKKNSIFNINMETYIDIIKKLNIYLQSLKNILNIEKTEIYLRKSENELMIVEYQKEIDRIKSTNGNVEAPYALDIFMMDEYQRQIFNYTYLDTRLRQKLWQRQRILSDLDNANNNLNIVLLSSDASDLLKTEKQNEVIRLTRLLEYHNDFIINYTNEFNILRAKEQFNEGTIELFDNNFESKHTDEKLSTYRFGCEDHSYCYGGVCTNSISPCSGMLYFFRRLSYSQSDISNMNTININVIEGEYQEILLARHTEHDLENYQFQWYLIEGYNFESSGEDSQIISGDDVGVQAGTGTMLSSLLIFEDIDTDNQMSGIGLQVENAFASSFSGNLTATNQNNDVIIVPKIGVINNKIGGTFILNNAISKVIISNGDVEYDSEISSVAEGVKSLSILTYDDNTWELDISALEANVATQEFFDDRYVISVHSVNNDVRKILVDKKSVLKLDGTIEVEYTQVDINILSKNDKLLVNANSEEFKDNELFYTPYSTDSQTAIKNLSHDPAKKISVRFKNNINTNSSNYEYVLKISRILGEASNGEKVTELVDSIKYNFIIGE